MSPSRSLTVTSLIAWIQLVDKIVDTAPAFPRKDVERARLFGARKAKEGRPMGKPGCTWQGVFPAATTQFDAAYAVDIEATATVLAGLIKDGVSGLIVCGTVGEGNTLSRDEKAAVVEAAVSVARSAGGRVPVLVGVADYTAGFAADIARMAA